MELGYLYKMVTGLKREEGHWLGYRYDAERGFHPEHADFWVGSLQGTMMHNSIRHRFWITDLFQTDSIVWASEAAGHVFKNPTLGLAAPWEFITLPGVLQGIWGLDDDCVFTWGIRGGQPIAYHWDGDDWRAVSSPGFIGRIHGAAPDQIYAVGLKGLIARWNGKGFETIPSPAKGTLSDVFVVSDDEIYACSHSGELFAGASDGWDLLLTHTDELNCVAKWQDALWVGGMDGLHRLDADALENKKPNLKPHRLDARGELLITQPTHMIETEDGENYTGISLEGLELCTKDRVPMWE